ncbi:MAG: protoporphyrinogen oxidase HemJ [Rhodobacteraceae bacterium]|nr:protoporphyrinogen oxidase HemJ [Paracoccaceae bacterium]
MTDLLISLYPWIRAVHILAVISWMAGLLYLPRLFVNHVEQAGNDQKIALIFQSMEKKLLRVIMNPAMIVTWIFGLMLVIIPGVVDWAGVWPWTKGASVLAMTIFHMWLSRKRKELANGSNNMTGRQFRLMNEVPTVLMVIIVLSVVLKF